MDTPETRPILIYKAGVAELLDVSPRTLDQWARTGYGPPWAIVGKHRAYRPADVMAWVDAQFEDAENAGETEDEARDA